MENKLEILKQAQNALNQMLEVLEQLEKEKAELLEQGKNIDEKNFFEYEQKLTESENKYANLLEEVQTIAEKIKKLKSMIC